MNFGPYCMFLGFRMYQPRQLWVPSFGLLGRMWPWGSLVQRGVGNSHRHVTLLWTDSNDADEIAFSCPDHHCFLPTPVQTFTVSHKQTMPTKPTSQNTNQCFPLSISRPRYLILLSLLQRDCLSSRVVFTHLGVVTPRYCSCGKNF